MPKLMMIFLLSVVAVITTALCAQSTENALSNDVEKYLNSDCMGMLADGKLKNRLPMPSSDQIKQLEKLADLGNERAMYILGEIYHHSVGVEEDDKKAFGYFSKAAEKEYPPAMNMLAEYYWEGKVIPKDEKRYFELLKAAAEKEYPLAMNMLGLAYEAGYGTEKNGKKALECFEKAAAKGCMKSMYHISRIFRYGAEGIDADKEKADRKASKNFSFFLSRAEEGNMDAQSWVAASYFTGDGVPKDMNENMKWIRSSREGTPVFNTYPCKSLHLLFQNPGRCECRCRNACQAE